MHHGRHRQPQRTGRKHTESSRFTRTRASGYCMSAFHSWTFHGFRGGSSHCSPKLQRTWPFAGLLGGQSAHLSMPSSVVTTRVSAGLGQVAIHVPSGRERAATRVNVEPPKPTSHAAPLQICKSTSEASV